MISEVGYDIEPLKKNQPVQKCHFVQFGTPYIKTYTPWQTSFSGRINLTAFPDIIHCTITTTYQKNFP